MLDTLPTVNEMKEEFRTRRLSNWTERISPGALAVLKWIVGSNRSCIVQVDSLEGKGVPPPEDRVYGMGNWMQFRLAMGAADKEERFAREVQRSAKNKPVPTLFAWHGSPMYNWHAIIREGLNFEQKVHIYSLMLLPWYDYL